MNDEASSSAVRASSYHEDGRLQSEAAPTAAELAERRKKNRQMFNRKRLDLLDDVLRNLDILVYAELSTIYYMDCSFLRFLLRAIVQFMFLTPKPAGFPDHPANTPSVGAILGSNIICFLLHLLLTPPSAGEPTRGYLHGGLAMDFIGQKGPTSKVHLLLLDLLLVLLQVTHMAANMVRKRLRDASSSGSGVVVDTQPAAEPAAGLQQDLDSEERGVNRSDEAQDIEMQSLNPSGTTAPAPESSTSVDESSEHDSQLLATTAPRSDAHIFDAFNSGQIVVADLDLWKTIKEQWQFMKDQRANADHLSQAQTLRAELAGRMLRMRIGTDMIRQNLS